MVQLSLLSFERIIKSNNMHILNDFMKGKDEICIMGSGPSLQKIEPKNNRVIICQNDAILVQKECDILSLADVLVLDRIDLDLLKNVKFILAANPLHNNGGQLLKENDITYIHQKWGEYFKGYYIPYGIGSYIPPPIKNDIIIDYNHFANKIPKVYALPFPQSHILVTYFAFLHLCGYNTPDKEKYTTPYNFLFYGTLSDPLESKDTRPYCEELLEARNQNNIKYGRDPVKVAEYHKNMIKNHEHNCKVCTKHVYGKELDFKQLAHYYRDHIVAMLDHFSDTITYTFKNISDIGIKSHTDRKEEVDENDSTEAKVETETEEPVDKGVSDKHESQDNQDKEKVETEKEKPVDS